ncbi:MAG: hypothetical protein FJX77_12650, partial [Armatimonadetes bacterium]|nr:hypothetical protein [Armatimonadota bacterium]
MSTRQLLLDRNRASIFAFECFWGVAFPFAYYATVLPGYLKHLDAPNILIGLAPAIHSGITALIQPYSAYAFRPGPHRSVWLRNMYASGSVAYIALGAAVLAGFLSGTTAVVFTLLTALVFAITVGLADPHYMDLVAEAAPADLRGRFFGLRVIFLGLGGVVGGELAEWVLGAAAPPQNFGASLCVGGVLYVLCTQALRRFQDPPVPTPEPLPAGSFSRYLGGSLGPLALHPRF